ncbi:MAG: type II secretion system F family protein [Planctomycetota bacterium]
MATNFTYEATDASGKRVKGSISAGSQNDVVADLRRRDLTPISIKKGGGRSKSGGSSSGGSFLSLSVGSKGKKQKTAKKASAGKGELEVFTRQLSTMLSAGIPLLEALEILGEQAESPGFRFCLEHLVEDIRNGADLSRAMEPHRKVFSDVYISMIRAGEASGQIDIILTRLAEYLEANAALKQEIKAAMTYPVISLCLVIGIAGFLLIGIVPSFQPVFESLEVELPQVTEILMAIALWMQGNWYMVVAGAVAAFFVFGAWKKTDSGQRSWDLFTLKAPVFGSLFQKVALSRFARTFSTLIKSGVPILGSMEIVSQTVGNRIISEVVDNAREAVKQGESLSKPFGESKMFPPMVTRMMAVGERSGALDQLLEKISEFYDQQVNAAVRGLTALIEPLMIAFMGLVVGAIVLAVFLPILKLQETLAG